MLSRGYRILFLQHQAEDGALAGEGVFEEEASVVVLFDDAFRQRQPQTPATLFGGEAGLEDFLLHVGCDAFADAALAALGAVGISDWAVPTKAQMQLVEARLLADDASLAGMKYLYRKSNDGLGYRALGAAETAWPTANTTDSYRLRPVAVVSITKD